MRKNQVNHSDNGYKIIVVDDEQGIVDSLSIFLRRSGYSFTGVTNPLEAIELVRNEHFDYLYYDKKIEENNKEIVKSVKKDELLIFIENIDINEYNGYITIDVLISCFKQ